MPALAIALLFLSASLHTLWNLLLKQSRQKIIASWWIVTVGAILFMPGLFFTGMPPREIWSFALISAGLEASYMLTLSLAYKNSDFSLVYPMARGTAPAFLLLWSLLFLHENLTNWGLVGLLMIISGLLLTGASSLIQNWTNMPNIKGIVENFRGILGPHHFNVNPALITLSSDARLVMYCFFEPRFPTNVTSAANIFRSREEMSFTSKKDGSNA